MSEEDGGAAGSGAPGQIDVVLEDLRQFSTGVGQDFEAYTGAWSQDAVISMKFPNFGGMNDRFPTIPEGEEFGRAYLNTLLAQVQLMIDVGAGMGALSMAALGIHNDLFNTEGATADELSGVVRDAFATPLNGGPQGTDPEAQARSEFEERVEEADPDNSDASLEDVIAIDDNPDNQARYIDVREAVWQDIEDADIRPVDPDQAAYLPNEGLPPIGHPHRVEIDEAPVYQGVDPAIYEEDVDES